MIKTLDILEFTIKSRKLGREVTFYRADGGYYVYIDLNGGYGITGNQICKGGKLRGNAISYYGDDLESFKKTCRNWFRQYIIG